MSSPIKNPSRINGLKYESIYGVNNIFEDWEGGQKDNREGQNFHVEHNRACVFEAAQNRHSTTLAKMNRKTVPESTLTFMGCKIAIE